eukprot:g8263.t1
MNRKEDDSKEPSRDGIDIEGIEARGWDTSGIYGLAREIIEKEEAQAPFRRLRLISYAIPAFIAVFLAGISLAGMAGLDEFKEVSENLPNPLVDAGIVGGAFYLWVEEVKTKRSSLALLKKEFEEQSKVPNRGSRRQKKSFGKKKKKGSATAAAAGAATTEQPPPPAAAAQAEAEAPAAPKKGMFEGVKETFDAVNKQSYYQALALNKELEDKGVLPPLERKPSPPGGDQEGEVAAEDGPELAAEAAATVATGVSDEGQPVAAAAAASQGDGGKRRKKGKGGKKGKRK